MTTTKRMPRTAAGLLTGGLLLFPLVACSDATVDDQAEEAISSATEEAAEDTGAATEEAEGGSSDPAGAPEVDCAATSCELTLQSGQQAEVLGTTIDFTSASGGEATIRVGGNEATCGEGEAVSAGPLSLECSDISDGSVTLTATLG